MSKKRLSPIERRRREERHRRLAKDLLQVLPNGPSHPIYWPSEPPEWIRLHRVTGFEYRDEQYHVCLQVATDFFRPWVPNHVVM